MIHHKEFILKGASEQSFAADLSYSKKGNPKGIILFCHGFKGFKDWGCWSMIANYFVSQGFAFLKFNFSHNGTGLENLEEFTNLEKFAINTLSKEVEDIRCVERFVMDEMPILVPEMNTQNVFIIGHSKGGVSALLYLTTCHSQIKKVVTWASPFDFHRNWSTAFIEKWKKDGIQFIKNARTNQMMPLDISVLHDIAVNKEHYSLVNAAEKLKIPYLIIQGTNDVAVKMEEFNLLKKHFTKAKTHIIQEANHVFGGSHPFSGSELPQDTKELVSVTKDFLIF
ncbi:S9 family peptidase [Flavobacterium sp. UMI-01]|uniref:alpha/beta hydrolase family protein n=1 Tax=Flavobacterium sp. UMI-01 TaxID=1441053 RepID=UPI001C7CE07D|nr:alpha/beta hydrolase [Flavobacterium sp. UMI-01]GIZ09883.1 hypothetical protein FUMI01_26090 [Flavobacterium sp. UMI-01]